MPPGVLPGMWRYSRGVDNTTSTTVSTDLIDLARREACVHQHWPRAKRGQGQQNCNKCPAVLTHHHDPVAWADPRGEEPALSVRDGRCELSIGPDTGCFHQRQSLRETIRPRPNYVANALR